VYNFLLDWYKFLYVSIVGRCKKEAIPLDPREKIFDAEDLDALNRLVSLSAHRRFKKF